MHPGTIRHVLAKRTYELTEGPVSRPVTVLIGLPFEMTDSADFRCPYQILGLGEARVRYTEGVDEAQAIYLAMEAIGTFLAGRPEAREGRLTWYGEPALGFPARSDRPQLRLVASQ